MKTKTIIILLAAYSSTFVCTQSTSAFGGVGIKPAHIQNTDHKNWFMYDLTPGSFLEDSLILLNTSDKTQQVMLYSADAIPTGDQGFGISQKGEYMSEIGHWISLEENTFELPPLQEIEVPFSLYFPEEASMEEFCGGLVVQEIKTDVSKKNLQLGTRNAARFYINYTDGNCGGSFVNICHFRAYPYDRLRHTEEEYYNIIAPIITRVSKSTLDTHLAHGDSLYDGSSCPIGPEPPPRPPQSHSLNPSHYVIKGSPEKRVNPQNNHDLEGKLTFFNASKTYEFLIDLDKSGQGYLSEAIIPGTYSVAFKGLSHLTKIISHIEVKENATIVLDFTENNQFELLAGDVAMSKDDYVNSLDIVATTRVLYQDDKHADLNKDGTVNAMDISIEIKNLHKSGEKIN